jgi:hypothetical protein
MITFFIYSEKAEGFGLRQLVLQAAANEPLGKVFSCSQEPVDQWDRHFFIQMCWRSGVTTFGDAQHILVTCIAIGCYRVTNIWLALNLTRPAWNPTNLWREQEITKHPVHSLQILPETYSFLPTRKMDAKSFSETSLTTYQPSLQSDTMFDIWLKRLTHLLLWLQNVQKWRFASEKYRVWTNRSYIKVAETAELSTHGHDTSCN